MQKKTLTPQGFHINAIRLIPIVLSGEWAIKISSNVEYKDESGEVRTVPVDYPTNYGELPPSIQTHLSKFLEWVAEKGVKDYIEIQ